MFFGVELFVAKLDLDLHDRSPGHKLAGNALADTGNRNQVHCTAVVAVHHSILDREEEDSFLVRLEDVPVLVGDTDVSRAEEDMPRQRL